MARFRPRLAQRCPAGAAYTEIAREAYVRLRIHRPHRRGGRVSTIVARSAAR
jgi:hypothetical protein